MPRPRSNPLGCCAAPSHPSSRVYTPQDHQATLWRGRTGSSSIRGPFCAPSRGRSPPAPAPHSCAAFGAVLVRWGCRVAIATRPFSVPSPFGAVGCCSRFFLFAVLFSAWFPHPCMHAQQHCIAICLGAVRCSRPVPPPSCDVALCGPWPCQVGAPPSRPSHLSLRCCTFIFFLSSTPSPPLCLLPALLVLFSCCVCSPLVVPAPWLYLARFHAPQGFCPVFRPVGRPGLPRQTPLQGDCPFVLPRRPPLHQFPDGRAARLVRLYAGHRHGVSL